MDMDQTQRPKTAADNRLMSLDILRGFDMFWIIGGGVLFGCLIDYFGWEWLSPIAAQLEHAEWKGFHAWDLIFPLFIFISGVTMPFSFERYLVLQRKGRLYRKVIKRAVILILLGWFYNGLLTTLDVANTRYLSVLGLIGLACLWASLVVINFKPAMQAVCAAAILLLYYVVMSVVPVPGYGAGVLTGEGNFASFIDRLIVPGQLHYGTHDPEGLLMTFPASVLAISGALAGVLLKNKTVGRYRKVVYLAAAGMVCLGIGLSWDSCFPMIKKLWTSSFVMYSVGWSLLLLSLFHLLVDVWGIRKVFFPFMLIGVNPLTIYICVRGVIDFKYPAVFILGGAARLAGESLQAVVINLAVLLCELLFLYLLYRNKVFLKV